MRNGLLVALLLAAAPAFASQSEVPERCLQLSRLVDTEVLNNHQIVFETTGKHYYLNTLPYPCPTLRPDSVLLFRTSIDMVCDVDVVTLLDQFGWGMQPRASCGLGKFAPIDEGEFKQLKEAAARP